MLLVQTIESKVRPVIWQENKLLILDQRLVPYEKKYLELTSYKHVINAIKDMAVRGAPLIGICGGYGIALAAIEFRNLETEKLINKLKAVGEEIKFSRPTAVNLKWAVDLVVSELGNWRTGELAKQSNDKEDIVECITKRAIWIHKDDANRCQQIGENGLALIKKILNNNSLVHKFTSSPVHVLTICNTGTLATGGIGTAFGVILTAHKKGFPIKVFASETRPRQQGARLTTFECFENGIDCTLISDTACGYLMQKGEIDLVITGADRIAANGDTANKIGTYQLAVLAKENNISFYVAAPLSTFDLKIKSGDEIPIEERSSEEVTNINEKPICAATTKARNPAFDITPNKYITGIITEKGILERDYNQAIKKVFNEVVVV